MGCANGIVAQWLERCPVKAEVAGSSPVSPAHLSYSVVRTVRRHVGQVAPMIRISESVPHFKV